LNLTVSLREQRGQVWWARDTILVSTKGQGMAAT
jgi:hypothetical protein